MRIVKWHVHRPYIFTYVRISWLRTRFHWRVISVRARGRPARHNKDQEPCISLSQPVDWSRGSQACTNKPHTKTLLPIPISFLHIVWMFFSVFSMSWSSLCLCVVHVDVRLVSVRGKMEPTYFQSLPPIIIITISGEGRAGSSKACCQRLANLHVRPNRT